MNEIKIEYKKYYYYNVGQTSTTPYLLFTKDKNLNYYIVNMRLYIVPRYKLYNHNDVVIDEEDDLDFIIQNNNLTNYIIFNIDIYNKFLDLNRR